MAANVPQPVNDVDEILEAIRNLARDAQVTRSAHFIAAHSKNRFSKIFGVIVVVLNILIGSGMIERFSSQDAAADIIQVIAFAAAAFAGIQTFFNFQKQVECHTKSGGVYSSITHRINTLVAEYLEQPANRDAQMQSFKALEAEYLQANDDAVACIPTDKHFAAARAGIEARGGR